MRYVNLNQTATQFLLFMTATLTMTTMKCDFIEAHESLPKSQWQDTVLLEIKISIEWCIGIVYSLRHEQ